MFPKFLVWCFALCSFPPAPQTAAPPAVPQRDTQAVAVVQQALNALESPPTDCTASGTVSLVAGSLSESATVRILTRGSGQSLESIHTPTYQSQIVYSGGMAAEVIRAQTAIHARTTWPTPAGSLYANPRAHTVGTGRVSISDYRLLN